MTQSSRRFFHPIDPELPDEERERLAGEAAQRLHDALTDEEMVLPQEEEEILRECASDKSPKVRAIAVGLLCEGGLATWDELEKWALDPAEEVRQETMLAMGSIGWSPTSKLCEGDKPRCVSVIASAAERYADYTAGNTMQRLSEQGPEWLRLTWQAADKLLNDASAELTTMLTCAYFEHVIPDNNWGPDDPHIGPWIRGTDASRKIVLLRIANYWGLEEGRLREMLEALVHDKEQSITKVAQGVLSGSITSRALWDDENGL